MRRGIRRYAELVKPFLLRCVGCARRNKITGRKSKIRTRNSVSDDYIVAKPSVIEVGYNCMGQCNVGGGDIISLLGKPKLASVVS